ncbi:hypothetical protein DSL72_000781 [Monilinia vaccinii-corymbosi]|uniref:Glucose-methanol-choline oxidoreductase C-terminal domain-containing protein n=1 Tax=Monilinia vaccinii-corymbosi TaxID=61207 RepID=A0A8A3P8S6_9HELO|nr:hypothetical protein DSL72_000781 [Monilinia vaccinii-corymbosi]
MNNLVSPDSPFNEFRIFYENEVLEEFTQDEARGRHVSCANPIGTVDDVLAVLDGSFRVGETRGLRVVDVNILSKIPGFYIVVLVYMVSKKAAAAIIKQNIARTGYKEVAIEGFYDSASGGAIWFSSLFCKTLL